jgi:shikimate kinase
MQNILLIGMPGSGKTKIGNLLADKFNCDFIDLDQFIFMQTGRDTAEHLAELGDTKFLDFEAEFAQKIQVKNTVIATSGSVPLHKIGFDHLRQNAITVWLKVSYEILTARVGKRADGASRIVGAGKKSLEEIFRERQTIYQKNHDFCFELIKEKPATEVAAKIFAKLQNNT